MANKTITDLQLITAITDDVNLAGDNGITTYRLTMAQLAAYVKIKLGSSRTVTGSVTIDPDTDNIILFNPSADFTQALPALSTVDDGTILEFKNIGLASDGYAVTLDGNGSEKIDDDLTLVLNSYPKMDSVRLLKTTTKWVVLP